MLLKGAISAPALFAFVATAAAAFPPTRTGYGSGDQGDSSGDQGDSGSQDGGDN
jgi:hypothetical protein